MTIQFVLTGSFSWPYLVARTVSLLEWLQFSSVPAVGPPARLWGFIRCVRRSGLWCFVPTSLVLMLLARRAGLPVSWLLGAFSYSGCRPRVGSSLGLYKGQFSIRQQLSDGNPTVRLLKGLRYNGVGWLPLSPRYHSFSFTATSVRESPTLSLTHFHIFSFSASVSWPHMQPPIRPRFLNSS